MKKEGGKKQARSNKQQGKATQYTQGSHFSYENELPQHLHVIFLCFSHQFYRKEVISHYVEYVNNFTDAMAILQKSIKKKPKFVNFLKEKYKDSKTSLSLQGLLLKPVQRFPQYILFLQVYTL